MEAQDEEENEEIFLLREGREQLCETVGYQQGARDDFMNNLSYVVPDLVASLELSFKVISSGGGRDVRRSTLSGKRSLSQVDAKRSAYFRGDESSRGIPNGDVFRNDGGNRPENKVFHRSLGRPDVETVSWLGRRDENGVGYKGVEVEKWRREDWAQNEGVRLEALSFVKGMVAACLLSSKTFIPIDSNGIHRRLARELTPPERGALVEVGGQGGGLRAVEKALRALAESTNGGLEIEEFGVSGKTRVMVLGVDRSRLSKETLNLSPGLRMIDDEGAAVHMRGMVMGMSAAGRNCVMFPHNLVPPGHLRPDMWSGISDSPVQSGPGTVPGPGPPTFPSSGGPVVQLGGSRGMPVVVGLPGPLGVGMGFGGMAGTFQWPPLLQQGLGVGPTGVVGKNRSGEDDELKDLEILLNKKSYRELQQSKTGEELLELLHRPTAKETAVAAKFKTKGGSALKEYCPALTKEDCRRQRGSFMACEKVHFRRIIAPHTDSNLGDCSFLDTCRHMKTCKYVHYELDQTQDVRGIMGGVPGLPSPKVPLPGPRRAEYCSDAELGEPQWINCDIRSFRMDVLGQFGVIMADPPWDIHMELPYGTMADDEMRNLNVPALQTNGLIFLWVTGRAMELGREWVEEMIWVKTNQLQRIIRTGRTGHWLNHSKEHCLVGIKGNPELNRNIDTDVIVAEVRETSRKPDEMYPLLERISPRTRKLELFARMHNTHAGWISLGNQLNGVRLVDEALRMRFKGAYPDTEVQPSDPPVKSSVLDLDSRSPVKSPLPSGFVEKETNEGGDVVTSAMVAGHRNGGKLGSDPDTVREDNQDNNQDLLS